MKLPGEGRERKKGLWRIKVNLDPEEGQLQTRGGERGAHKTTRRKVVELRSVNFVEVIGKGTGKGSKVSKATEHPFTKRN